MKKTTLWISLGALIFIVAAIGWFLLVFHLVKNDIAIYRQAQDVTGYQIRFGILETDSDGNQVLATETTTLPLKYKDSGFRFGLEIKPPDDKPYRSYCVFHFPTPPKIISGFTSNEPSTTMTEEESESQGTAIEEHWFDPGDPVGDQSIDIYINGKLAKTIKYTVVAEK